MMLLCHFQIGTPLVIGVDASYWVGSLAGIQNGVVILSNAQLYANMGKPIDGMRQTVRIPLRMITFVALKDAKSDKDNGKDNKKDNKNEDNKDNNKNDDKNDDKKDDNKKDDKKTCRFWQIWRRIKLFR